MTDFQSQYGAPQFDADFGQPAQPDPQARKPKGRRPRKPKGVEKPRSGARTIILLAAVVGAVFAALYFAGADDPTLGGTYVVQVKRNVAAYTEITPDHLQPVQVNETLLATRQGETGEVVNYDGLFVATSPEAAIEAVFTRPQDADSELSETVTRIARREIAAGSLLHKDDITISSQLVDYIEGLQPTDRLVSIEALPVTAVGGKIQPGDRVDIVLVNSQLEVGRTFLTDIPVVDVNLASTALESLYATQLEDPEVGTDQLLPGDPLPGIYTLVIPYEHVAALTTTAETSTIYLVARPDNAVDPMTEALVGEDGETLTEPEVILPMASVLETLCPGDVDTLVGVGGFDAPGVEEEGSAPVELPRKCVAELLRLEADIARDAVGGGYEGELGADEEFTTLEP